MEIVKQKEGSSLTISLEGTLNTTTSPQLESELKQSLEGITALVFDLAKLEYISSAGLRVLLSAQKIMNKQGEMKVTGANDELKEIFEVTGFVDILNIE